MARFQRQPGVYALVVKVGNTSKLKIGALGDVEFQRGYYVYAGSAMNGLAARIARHKRKQKRVHWHIDYLLAKAELIEVIKIPTSKRLECKFSQHISGYAESSIPGFGCSDCACSSHLYYFKHHSNIEVLKKSIKSIDKKVYFRDHS